jgi:hypothetical protein
MSKLQSEIIKCSACEQEFSIVCYKSLNVSLMPDLKEPFLNDELNVGTCPKCGVIYEIETDVLYHDMEKRTMIAVMPESFLSDKEEYIRYYKEIMGGITAQLNGNLKERFNEYIIDVVFGIDDLGKKLDIIDVMKEPDNNSEDALRAKMLKGLEISKRESQKKEKGRVVWKIPVKEEPKTPFFQNIKNGFKNFFRE